MTSCQPDMARQAIDRYTAVIPLDDRDGVAHSPVDPCAVRVGEQGGDDRAGGDRRRTDVACVRSTDQASCHVACVFDGSEQRRRNVVDADDQVGQLVLRRADQCSRAVRMKADADDRDSSRRAQRQLTGELSGDERGRLPLDRAAAVKALECVAEMHHQLGAAVRQHRLNRRAEVVGMAFERPHAAHDRGERRRRCALGVVHAAHGSIAGRICSSVRPVSASTVTIMRMMLALVVVGAVVTAQSPRPPASASIGQVAWIAGAWSGGGGGTTFEERWTPPAGGAMLAVSRTLKADRMVAFEFLRIVERNGGLVYVAQPDGRPPTDFVLTEVSADSATFENPAHDFPKMIRYSRKSDGTLEARISDGGQKGESFVFRRIP